MRSTFELVRRYIAQVTRRHQRPRQSTRGSFRRLRLEPLEDRRLLAVTVNTLVDENDGVGIGAGTSLREALFVAAIGEVIDFSVTGTINLTNLGHLNIVKDVRIQGPGAELLTIRGYNPTPSTDNGDGSRIFNIDDGNPNIAANVEITGITLSGGDAVGSGGAIYAAENLMLSNSVVTGNATVAGGPSSTKRNGGGIYQASGSLTIVDTTISNNRAISGGAVYTTATATIRNSTIADNQAAEGAGITQNVGVLSLVSSTVSGNAATAHGGGIRAVAGSLTLAHSTIFKNIADSDDSGGGNAGRGGGISIGASVVSLDHTIVAGNIRRVNTSEDIIGQVTARYSLIGNNSSATIISSALNLVGYPSAIINPQLGPLADNGGATKSHALLPLSPAIDLGDPYAEAGVDGVPQFDQRGASFGRVSDGNGVHGARIDIGAIEAQSSVMPPDLLGDFNRDGTVDIADYCVWRDTMGQMGVTPFSGADGDGDGNIGPSDYSVWKSHFGESLPASGSASLAVSSVASSESSTNEVEYAQAAPTSFSAATAYSMISSTTPGALDPSAVESTTPSLGEEMAIADQIAARGLLAWLAAKTRPPVEPGESADPIAEVSDGSDADAVDVSFAIFNEAASLPHF